MSQRGFDTIDQIFLKNVATKSDINEHLMTLYHLSALCDSVTEFGVRGGVSSSALMAAQSRRVELGLFAKYTGYDINAGCIAVVEALSRKCHKLLPVSFTVADTVAMPCIGLCGMLFIDTKHDCDVVRAEVIKHAPSVLRFMAFHDTETFGEKGETPGAQGLRYGINDALAALEDAPGMNKWKEIYRSTVNNGLLVLERTYRD